MKRAIGASERDCQFDRRGDLKQTTSREVVKLKPRDSPKAGNG